MRKRVFLTILLFVFSLTIFSQSFFSPGAWKHYRKEWQFSFGASNFLGDLGGKDQIGTNFLKDWEISQTRYVGRLGFGYYLDQNWMYRSSLNIGVVSGNDRTTKEPFRSNRNLSFSSTIIEFNQNILFLIVREKMGNKYGLKNIKGKRIGAKSNAYGLFITAGVGVFYYNPKSVYNGQK